MPLLCWGVGKGQARRQGLLTCAVGALPFLQKHLNSFGAKNSFGATNQPACASKLAWAEPWLAAPFGRGNAPTKRRRRDFIQKHLRCQSKSEKIIKLPSSKLSFEQLLAEHKCYPLAKATNLKEVQIVAESIID